MKASRFLRQKEKLRPKRRSLVAERRLSIRIHPINMERKWSPSHLEKKIKQAAMRMKRDRVNQANRASISTECMHPVYDESYNI